MKLNVFMIYKEVLEKRLIRKKEQLNQLEAQLEGIVSPHDKRKYIELNAIINELENCIDIAESMAKLED